MRRTKKLPSIIIEMRSANCINNRREDIKKGVEIILPFTKTAWAEYLNVSRTSLSRELKSMELDGIIKVNGNKIIPLYIGELNKVMW